MDSSSSFAITDEEFNLFHAQDRKLFTRLINDLNLDPNESVHIMGFWLWLEQVHLKDASIIHKVVTLSLHLLILVVDETRLGMNLIEHDTIPPQHFFMEFKLLEKLTRNSLPLQQLHAKRLTILDGVSRLIDNVCVRAFRDIIENFTNNIEQNRAHHVHVPDVGQPFDPVDQGVVMAPAPTWELGTPSNLTGHGVPIRVMGDHSNWQNGVIAPTPPTKEIGEPSNLIGHGVPIAPGPTREVGDLSNLIGNGVPMIVIGEHPNWQGGVIAPPLTSEPTNLIGHDVPMRVIGEHPDRQGVVVPPPPSGLMLGGGTLLVGDIPIIRPVMVESHEFQPHFYPGPAVPFHPGTQFQDPTYPMQFGGYIPGMVARNEMNISYDRYDGIPDVGVEKSKRKIFLTFSRGYPVSSEELWDFFTWRFGDFIESIRMPEVSGDEQVMFAIMVSKSVAMMQRVVDGDRGKYFINGKHVCARKYVKKLRPGRDGPL